MSTIAQEIMSIATEHGYTGAAQPTIAGAINALADTLAGEDAHDGKTIASAIKSLAPYVGEVPSGTISITENGTDIDVASYAKADVSVSGGASFGELHLVPMEASAAPTVGGNAESIEPVGVAKIGTSADAAIVDSGGTNASITWVASGVYLTVMPAVSNAPSSAGYVVTVDTQEGKYATVTQWDGTITLDTTSVEHYNCFGLTMPELEQNEFLILVFSGIAD